MHQNINRIEGIRVGQEKTFEQSVASWIDLLAILFFLSLIFSFWASINQNYSFVTNTFFQSMVLVSLVITFLKIRGGNWQHLGLRKIPTWRGVALAIVAGLGIAFLMTGISWLIQLLPWPVSQQAAYEAINRVSSWQEFLPLWFAVGFLAPLSEEVFFRGYTLPLFRNYLGQQNGAILAALFFGALHFDAWRMLPLAVAGWILNQLYTRTGSLWTTIIAHGVWNATLALQLSWGRLY
ncbi:MAG: type II CAAX endopeptidase family protein [Carboxydocellales bacterium]